MDKLEYLLLVRDLASGIFIKDRFLITEAINKLLELVGLRSPSEIEVDGILEVHDLLIEIIHELEED